MSPTNKGERGEHQLINSLGISLAGGGGQIKDDSSPDLVEDSGYEVVPNPSAEAANWSDMPKKKNGAGAAAAKKNNDPDADLDALEELVPDIKKRRCSNEPEGGEGEKTHDDGIVEVDVDDHMAPSKGDALKRMSMASGASSTFNRPIAAQPAEMNRADSMRVQESKDFDESKASGEGAGVAGNVPSPVQEDAMYNQQNEATSSHDEDDDELYDGLDGNESDTPAPGDAKEGLGEGGETKIPKEFLNMSSGQSLSTATQTHEVRMPMYLPTFKPATGCTNASDFIVRCFVARLRSGITVVKHGRSRWCKSRLRILHIHPDGCSLSWKPAEGEPTSNRRPPKLDLTQCLEVRHAWSPDPQNPMYTGTPILRQKCEAANAHKSFALIFPKRTVDITAVTADQCKVLMEGFSALCFRLQVADLAGKGANKKTGAGKGVPEEDGVSTTASVTLTNSSTPRGR